jgi:DNA-directed RNA polymerase beta' subunit
MVSSTADASPTSDLNDLYRRVINRNNRCVACSTSGRPT